MPECIYAGVLFFYSMISVYLNFPYAIIPLSKYTAQSTSQTQNSDRTSKIRPRYNPRSGRYYIYIDGEMLYIDSEPTEEDIENKIQCHLQTEKPRKNSSLSKKLFVLFFAVCLFSWISVISSSHFINEKVIKHTYVTEMAVITDVSSYVKREIDDEGEGHYVKVYEYNYEYEYGGEKCQGVFSSRKEHIKGSQLTVFINPSDSSEKYVESEFESSLIFIILGTILMIVFYKMMIYVVLA